MLNRGNINKLIEVIKADQGKHLVMQVFVCTIRESRISIDPAPQGYIDCKTACCLAGWANTIILSEKGINWKTLKGYDFQDELACPNRAAEWLGLDDKAAADLFRMESEEFTSLYKFDRLPDEVRHRAAVEVLEHLRDTGVVNWKRAITIAQEAIATSE